MLDSSGLRLFDVNENDGYKVTLNKDWLMLIPQFVALIRADKGSEGDYRGDKKLKAIKQFTYIYHMTDPRSPLENAETRTNTPGERREKSLAYAELTEKDVNDSIIIEAYEEYEYLLSIAVPSLGMLRSAKNTMKKLQDHFDTINFNERDKKGALVHSASNHIANVKNLKQLHMAIKEFDVMVMEELRQSTGIRGSATMGDRESGHRKAEWKEGGGRPVTVVMEDAKPDWVAVLGTDSDDVTDDDSEYPTLGEDTPNPFEE